MRYHTAYHGGTDRTSSKSSPRSLLLPTPSSTLAPPCPTPPLSTPPPPLGGAVTA